MNRNEILKSLIEKSGLTKKQFAEKHGYKTYRIYDWTNGKRNISLFNLEVIAFNENFDLTLKLQKR
jgi:transcriptional regulator with XRE-family HTH domain